MSEESIIENHLKELRIRHKLSQEELAEKLGVSRQSIISLEQGRSYPSLPLAISICQFFDSAFEELFSFDRELKKEVDVLFNNEMEETKCNDIINNANVANSKALNIEKEPNATRKEIKMFNELEPWRPIREVISLRDAMDRLLEGSFVSPKTTVGMPKIDIKDKKDSVIVKAELPGMTEDEIDVEISEGVMTISGERKEEKEKEEEGYYYKESHSGTFSRSFNLPGELAEDKATAEMEKGILTISIPKIAPKQAKKVKIAPKKK